MMNLFHSVALRLAKILATPLFALPAATLCIVPVVFAQTATPTPADAVVVSTKDDEGRAPASVPNTAAGQPEMVWTLRDAISTALENNVDIAIERKNLRIGEFAILSAEGVYEPVFKAEPSFNSARQPNIGRFSGVSANENSTNTTSFDLNPGIEKRLRTGGGSFALSFDNPRTSSNSAIISPLYSPQLSVTYTQPLFRNRQIDSSRLQILVAKKTLTLTDAQFRQQVISIINQVQQAYWNLAFALRNVSVQSDGVALAQKQVDQNQKQVDTGMLAPLEVVAARTTLESRNQALIQARINAIQAQNALKTLVVDSTRSAIWDKEIIPSDFYDEQPSGQSLADALESGYSSRPEVDQFKTQEDIDRLNIKYLRNQTKPQIDLVSTYSVTGAAGTPTSSLACPAGSALGSAGLCTPGNVAPTLTPASVNPKFAGGYLAALQNLATNRFNTVSVGLSISLPFHNKTAQADLGSALVTESQTELQERKQLQTIEADVRNAFQTVGLARQNLDAARLERQFAEIQLDGEEKKFASGLSTTFLVLTQQNALIQARGAEISALAAYNNAVAALQQATGTTLSSNNVEIK